VLNLSHAAETFPLFCSWDPSGLEH
jgi:hypothetical protein